MKYRAVQPIRLGDVDYQPGQELQAEPTDKIIKALVAHGNLVALPLEPEPEPAEPKTTAKK